MGPSDGDDHRLRRALTRAGVVGHPTNVRARRALLLALVVSTALSAGATTSTSRAAPVDLRTELGLALRTPGISHRQTGAVAIDLRTGRTVYAHNRHASLLPASAEKLPVAYAALKLLGPGYRFRTDVVGLGSRRGPVWRGNLWLVGGGDPTLRPSDLDRLARRLARRGLRRVEGRVLGDDSRFDARREGLGWKSRYLGIESRPISALSVARVKPTGVNGSAIAAARSYVGALRAHGIEVTGRSGARPAPDGTRLIASDVSEPLSAVLRLVNGESDNFAAEMILKELGATTGDGSSEGGARVVRSTLRAAGVPLAGVRIADGSGLSRFDRLTADALATLLRAALADPAVGDPFVSSLAVAGVSGTLEERLGTRPTRGRVVAKTGTTLRASALAGYVGRRYVFAILQNGAPIPYWIARAAQDRFVTVLARA